MFQVHVNTWLYSREIIWGEDSDYAVVGMYWLKSARSGVLDWLDIGFPQWQCVMLLVSNLLPTGCLLPRMAMNGAQHKVVNLLKTFFLLLSFSLVFVYSMCTLRQPYFPCGPETPKGWTALIEIPIFLLCFSASYILFGLKIYLLLWSLAFSQEAERFLFLFFFPLTSV